jgi:hypothetical protein
VWVVADGLYSPRCLGEKLSETFHERVNPLIMSRAIAALPAPDSTISATPVPHCYSTAASIPSTSRNFWGTPQ